MRHLATRRFWHSQLPGYLGGTPVLVGTRVPVQSLLDYLEAGDSLDDFLDHFPSVSREQAVVAAKLTSTRPTSKNVPRDRSRP